MKHVRIASVFNEHRPHRPLLYLTTTDILFTERETNYHEHIFTRQKFETALSNTLQPVYDLLQVAILLEVVDQCVRRVSLNTLTNSKLGIKLKRKNRKKNSLCAQKRPHRVPY